MRGKRLTRRQKIFLTEDVKNIKPENWLAAQETDTQLIIIHKVSGKVKIISKTM
jgi:hypothetical protein